MQVREGREFEAATCPVAGIETPANLRPRREVSPERLGVVVGVEVRPHQWVARHAEHVIHGAPRSGQGKQVHKQIGRLADLADATVGHDQRQPDRACDGVADAARHGPLENRLEVRCGLLQAGADDHHLMRLEAVDLLKGLQDRVVKHLGLSRQAMAPMDRDRSVRGGVVMPGDGLTAGGDRLLHAAEQRVGDRLGSRSGRLVDADALRRQQVLQFLGPRQPDRQELIDAVKKLGIRAAPQGGPVVRRLRQRLCPTGSQARRGMHEQHPHIARASELLKTLPLIERERLQSGHEQRFTARLVCETHAGRWRWRADVLTHRTPEVELPVIGSIEPRRLAFTVTNHVGSGRTDHGVSLLPPQDHAGPTDVVVVEEGSEPSCGEQRLGSRVEREWKVGAAGDDREDREREPIQRPGVGGLPAGRLQQGRD